jgi:hypothetical protein
VVVDLVFSVIIVPAIVLSVSLGMKFVEKNASMICRVCNSNREEVVEQESGAN